VLATTTVVFPDAPEAPTLEVEVAKKSEEAERGLMYRRSMPDHRGMLFAFQERRTHAFWMRNTCISLDMMFVDTDGVIVGIVESAEPLSETSQSVGCASSWVIETNAGWTRRHGIRPGQKVQIASMK